MKRALNFNAGPAALPQAVLEKAQQEWLNYLDTGMAVMELSHRSAEYEQIHNTADRLLRRLMQIPDDYEVLFLQGGASLQFTMVPMNLLRNDETAYYIMTGSWSEKALNEARKIGAAASLASGKEGKYKKIPDLEATTPNDASYVHLTSNNTIFGTQWQTFPDHFDAPLVADMSSDILSKPINVNQFGLIYAGAQKNLGPSGVTVVIIKKDLLARSGEGLPTMLNYQTHAKNRSLYNTPPTLSIYLLSLVLEWVESLGGLPAIEKINKEKAEMLYHVIDESNGFYRGHADQGSRSLMNITFTLETDEATAAFLKQAKEAGFIGLNGHRSVGGCRASLYNAVTVEQVNELAEFMKSFRKNY
ncbi:3-phosphoserine/phosphohydroxythreonine transaminase [Bacillus sp. V3-13]|uniref:3-phosphoserine/phosphohydroxythreonine transaminase n=1 Tax=Bacillus sp. V3-13 TaxID=2053728 RepID=UPI000C78BE7B|nr:3-phosphoserine/phosphohydroxythreonine transaminase [Bacillus sp. V3-13]PLR77976.1 3-phosphoserine/phosphohydroxythreonine transaminase [Bacillus sp. V3-13]